MSAPRASAALALILLCGFAPPTPPAPPQTLAEIPRTDFLAEGVAVTPKGAILVSGVQGRTVLQLAGHGFKPWLKGQSTGGLFGMAVDARRGRLWVSETAGDQVPGSTGPRVTDVLEARLSDGRILARHMAPQNGKPHWIGDLVAADDGTVYASDSVNGEVYRLKPGAAGDLERLAQTGLKSPQGLVVGADGHSLILGDYSTGLHRVEIATGEVGPTLPGGGAELRGLDGLKRYGRDLIGTQNGVAPQRVIRLRLAPDERSVEGVEVLARGPAVLEDVSLGAVDADRFVFVARSGWAAFGDDGHPNGKPVLPPVMAAIPLKPS